MKGEDILKLPKNPFKKEKPLPLTAERRNLLRLSTGTLIDVVPMGDTGSAESDLFFTYTSILKEFKSNDTAVIFANSSSDHSLELGTQYNIIFKTNTGIYKDNIEVTNFIKEDEPLIEVKFVGKTVKQQRRRHVRIEDYVKFDFEVIESKASASADSDATVSASVVEKFERFQKQKEYEVVKMKKYMQLFFERVQDKTNPMVFPYSSETLDISSGGMRFIAPYKMEEESIIGVRLHINNREVLVIAKINNMDDLTQYHNSAEVPVVKEEESLKNEDLPEPDPVQVNETYVEAAINFSYMYKCAFVAMHPDTKDYLHQYIIDKTLL